MALARQPFAGPRLGFQQIPQVDFVSGAGDAISALGSAFLVGSKIASEKLRRENLKLSKEEGFRIGAEGDVRAGPQLLDAADEFSAAYNTAVKKMYAQRVDTLLRAKVRESAVLYRDNPAAFQKSLQSFAAGMKGKMPFEFQGAFDQQVATLATPKLLAIYERQFDALEKSRAASLTAHNEATYADAQEFGRLLGKNDSSSEAAAMAAGDGYLQSLQNIVSGIGLDYTAGQAQENIVEFTSKYISRMMRGVFDGLKTQTQKEMMLNALSRGELEIGVPVVKEVELHGDRQQVVAFELANAGGVMKAKDLGEAITYMSQQVGRFQEADDRERVITERMAQEAVTGNLRFLATAGHNEEARIAAMRELETNAFATGPDIAAGRKWFVEGVSDPGYVGSIKAQVIMPSSSIRDISELDANKMSFKDRDDIDKLIQARNLWEKTPIFKQAVTTIDLDVRRQADKVISLVSGGSDRNNLRRQAGASFELAMRNRVRIAISQGQLLGANASNKAYEVFKDANGNNQTRFDPESWVRVQLGLIKDTLGPLEKELASLRKERRRVSRGGQPGEAGNLMKLVRDVTRARKKLEQEFLDLVVDRFD